jgi:hypothetical protein
MSARTGLSALQDASGQLAEVGYFRYATQGAVKDLPAAADYVGDVLNLATVGGYLANSFDFIGDSILVLLRIRLTAVKADMAVKIESSSRHTIGPDKVPAIVATNDAPVVQQSDAGAGPGTTPPDVSDHP